MARPAPFKELAHADAGEEGPAVWRTRGQPPGPWAASTGHRAPEFQALRRVSSTCCPSWVAWGKPVGREAEASGASFPWAQNSHRPVHQTEDPRHRATTPGGFAFSRQGQREEDGCKGGPGPGRLESDLPEGRPPSPIVLRNSLNGQILLQRAAGDHHARGLQPVFRKMPSPTTTPRSQPPSAGTCQPSRVEWMGLGEGLGHHRAGLSLCWGSCRSQGLGTGPVKAQVTKQTVTPADAHSPQLAADGQRPVSECVVCVLPCVGACRQCGGECGVRGVRGGVSVCAIRIV